MEWMLSSEKRLGFAIEITPVLLQIKLVVYVNKYLAATFCMLPCSYASQNAAL